MSTLPSTTAEQEELPTTGVRHALAEDLNGVAEVLRAELLPNTDACLQQLREIVSRAQRSVDLATASAESSSNYTVEELEAAHSLTRARVVLAVVDIKSAEVRNADVEKALHTQRKAAAAAEAVGESARFFRILPGRVVQPHPSAEPLQQSMTDGQSSVVFAISDVGGGRRNAVRSADEGVAALTHVAAREEDDASTRITRALEFDPETTRVAYAAGLSMLCVLVSP